MTITNRQITEIAALARLGLGDDGDAETTRYAAQLSEILALIEQMNAVDTDGITPMSHPSEAALRLWEDVVDPAAYGEQLRDEFQRIAPATAGGLYLTPRVIDG